MYFSNAHYYACLRKKKQRMRNKAIHANKWTTYLYLTLWGNCCRNSFVQKVIPVVLPKLKKPLVLPATQSCVLQFTCLPPIEVLYYHVAWGLLHCICIIFLNKENNYCHLVHLSVTDLCHLSDLSVYFVKQPPKFPKKDKFYQAIWMSKLPFLPLYLGLRDRAMRQVRSE